jgi:hypothetical protein
MYDHVTRKQWRPQIALCIITHITTWYPTDTQTEMKGQFYVTDDFDPDAKVLLYVRTLNAVL